MIKEPIKNLPDALYDKIKQSAAENRHSINPKAIFLLERYFADEAYNFDAKIAEVRQLRDKLGIYVTDEEINKAKNEGRP